jgi:hypothetical protein
MMIRKMLLSVALISAVSTALAGDIGQSKTTLSAAEVAEKNVQARGGLQAWRNVNSLSFEGRMGAGGNRQAPVPASLQDKGQYKPRITERLPEEAQLPFKMLMQRPRQMRVELVFKGQTAVQVFDGVHGWKLRPFLNRNEVEPFTADELKAASLQPVLDGPIVDYAAKGTRIELDGLEKVEGHDAYKLGLTNTNGETIHVWIDTGTFLETKIDGQPRRLDGKLHPIEVYYRDYRQVSGLQIPFIMETKVLPIPDTTAKVKEAPVQAEKIIVENVAVNPKLEASLFTKPEIQNQASHR